MGEVHHLSTNADSQSRLLELWITEIIAQHPDEQVARRWSELATQSAIKFPGIPTPSQPEIDLSTLTTLSEEQRDQVFNVVQEFMSCYFIDVRAQVMDMHSEILKTQKALAELQCSSN